MAREHDGVLQQLRQSEAGNVFPLTAAAIFVLAGLVGGGVDASRAYLVENKLQNACDAGVLAGRKNVRGEGFNAEAVAAAKSYFNVNMTGISDIDIPAFVPTSSDNGNTIEAVVSTKVDTTLMRVFGIDNIPIKVSCTASMSMGNADVMMVLDTTGSMNRDINGNNTWDNSKRRITLLRDAMESFYDTVAKSADGTNARIRYGFVPYSSSVNVGRLLEPDWIVDRMNLQSRVPEYNTKTETIVVGYEPPRYTTNSGTNDLTSENWSRYNNSWYDDEPECNNAKPSDGAWRNKGKSKTEERTYINSAKQRITEKRTWQEQDRTVYRCRVAYTYWYWLDDRKEKREIFSEELTIEDPIFEEVTTKTFKRWLYKERKQSDGDDLDVSNYKLFNVTEIENDDDDGSKKPYTWKGCIEERGTASEATFSFSSLLGMSPYTWDLDIDKAPDGSEESKWRPLWPEMAYRRGTSSSIYRQDRGYDGHPTGSGCPSQAKLLDELSKDEFMAEANKLSPEGSTYLDLGMIWGGRLLSPTGMFASTVMDPPQNGAEVARHIIFLTDGEMEPSWSGYSAYGTEYYDKRVTDDGTSQQKSRHTSRFRAVCQAVRAKGIRIWVIAFGSDLSADLQACASPQSSFDAKNSEGLKEAFQDIAKNVGELRITM
ncbi:MAG: pilus assembly protein TadG [Altererythrobacter sp.]|nr:pilus assembly protein TadG [Erythrobacter sp.]MAW89760.1 pilus assembly protein TadG [Altererythrobacter sp.]MAW89982.1 pilus assembly protein TadG [Altererythrobacter sp.]MBK61905.1 pilus assembly protein TadG [Altererythrobacter sp.]|tara:strand:- start:406 stop:2373 length:1968 start_codon:yes stop_codon:yes gene_type:complete